MPREGLVTLAHVIYGLHAFSGAHRDAESGDDHHGLPHRLAVDHRGDPELREARGRAPAPGSTSHFSWQIRTFWFALLWLTLGAVLFVTVVGMPFAIVLWFATGIWVLYRIIRGWLALSSQKALPQ